MPFSRSSLWRASEVLWEDGKCRKAGRRRSESAGVVARGLPSLQDWRSLKRSSCQRVVHVLRRELVSAFSVSVPADNARGRGHVKPGGSDGQVHLPGFVNGLQAAWQKHFHE